ncbi:MAG: Fic/DOC family N-terminal domain-containing protein [Acidimicrobiia bacterium]
MDIDRFRDSPIGTLVPITVEQHGRKISHHAFQPDPLPKSIDLTPDTYSTIEAAAMELGRLEGASTQLDRPYLLTRPIIRREAVSTSALEGTFSTLEDLFASEIDEIELTQPIQEVANYVDAAEMGVRELATRPVSRNLLCELHEVLMRASENESSSGRLRSTQVAIGPRGSLITEARFVPPPPGPGLEELFSDWERWNYEEDALPLLARIAVSHYQFETIHPFIDGNGRIGRLVAILLLIDRGPLSNHYMVLSPYLERRRERYVELLAQTTATGDFDPWVRFFSEAIRAEASVARSRITALIEYRTNTVERVRRAGLKGTIITITEQLIERPVLTPSAIAKRLNVRYQTANRAVSKLVEEGILEETTGRTYGRVFVAREVLRLLRLGAD